MVKVIGIKDPDCQHHWKVYMVRRGKESGVLKYRYYRCLNCGSTMKTVEQPTDFKHKR
jgi:hypothetical protein